MSTSRSTVCSGHSEPVGPPLTGYSLPLLACPPKRVAARAEESSGTGSMERSQYGCQWPGTAQAEEGWLYGSTSSRNLKRSKVTGADVAEMSLEFQRRRRFKCHTNVSGKDGRSSLSVMLETGCEGHQHSLAGGSGKGTSSPPASDGVFPYLEGGKTKPCDVAHLKAEIKYDPKTYGSLLPTVLKIRAVEEAVSGPLVGLVANEMFANRDAKQMLRGILEPTRKAPQHSQFFDRHQFESKMKQLEESARYFNRRLEQRVSGNAGGCGTMIIVDDSSDRSSNDGRLVGGSCAQKTHGTEQVISEGHKVDDAAYASRKQRLNELRSIPQRACSSVVLREALKESRIAVWKAQCNAINVGRGDVGLAESSRRERLRSVGFQEAAVVLPTEEVSWDTGVTISNRPGQGSLASARGSTCSVDGQRSKVVTDQRAAAMLESFLHGGKGSTSGVALPTALCGTSRSASCGHMLASPETSRLPSVLESALGDIFSQGELSPCGHRMGTSMRGSQQQRKGTDCAVPLPPVLAVGYGMSARAQKNYEAMMESWELSEIEQELRNGEGLCQVRRRLLSLLPDRKRMLEASLGYLQRSPQLALSMHRREIFRKVAEVDAADRRQACLSFVDVLEQCCRNTLDDTAWSVVSSALKCTRDLIQISTSRCNPHNFLSILNDCVPLQHISDERIRDALQWLAKLFSVSQSQLRAALQSLHRRLNKPRDYETRFHEIDSSLCGVVAPTERRVRIRLRRCNFQLPRPGSVGCLPNALTTGGGDGVLGAVLPPEACADRPEVSVMLRVDNETSVSSTLYAQRTNDGAFANAGCNTVDDALFYVVDFDDELVQLKPADSSVVHVTLICDGVTLCGGFLHLSRCVFHANRNLTVRLRLDNKRVFLADLRVNLELACDKDRRGRGGRR